MHQEELEDLARAGCLVAMVIRVHASEYWIGHCEKGEFTIDGEYTCPGVHALRLSRWPEVEGKPFPIRLAKK